MPDSCFKRAQYRFRTQLGEDDWQALLQICERAARAAKDAALFRARSDLQFSSGILRTNWEPEHSSHRSQAPFVCLSL